MNNQKKKSVLSKIERRAQALRENLRKRKHQQRTREPLKTETLSLGDFLSPESSDQQEEVLSSEN